MNFRTKNHCFLLILSFCLFFFHFSTTDTESALVVGTVYCDTCFHQHFSKSSRFISGASVSVECGDFRKEAKTNRHGVFRVRLPPKVNTVKTCSVNLIRSNEPSCSVASSSPSSSTLLLKSKRNSLHVFSAGLFAFKPLKQPELCYNIHSFANKKKKVQLQPQHLQPDFFFFPPPIPFLPSPPNIGGIPLPPNPLVPPPTILPPVIPLPPNPLVPPPTILPPVIPSPPPSILPPIFPSPPPSFFPPLPFITPPPPPPPASLFPPFPIPLPPNPLFPGNPPALHAEETSP